MLNYINYINSNLIIQKKTIGTNKLVKKLAFLK